MTLSTAQQEEGITDPIIAYEYMNKFYVLEGNKRVSVLKYYDAVSVMGQVTRILPKKQMIMMLNFIMNLLISIVCQKSITYIFQN